jgi:hypothetical protein
VSGSKRVDLDLDGTYGLANLDVEGLPLRFDEEVPSDLKVLCYFAYSPLYTGDPQARREQLGLTRCLDLRLETIFPATVRPEVSTLLSVRVSDLDTADDMGDALGQAGVRIELNPSGGTVDQFAGITDADGIFQTNARLFVGQPELVIEVIARAGENGPELARATLSSAGAVGGVSRITSRGMVDANVPSFPTGGPCLDEQFRRSPAGATEWSDSFSCNGINGSGTPESASAMASFTESYAGSDLVAVTASASGTASSESAGSGEYELTFSVVQTTTMVIDAQLSTGGFSAAAFTFVGIPEPIHSEVAGAIHETRTLSPGNYSLVISAVGNGGGASFNLAVTFGPPA